MRPLAVGSHLKTQETIAELVAISESTAKAPDELAVHRALLSGTGHLSNRPGLCRMFVRAAHAA
jgi:hypothetical protein